MKTLRSSFGPTRSRRLNELSGLVALVAATLLLLALATYTPADPSLNTAGGYAAGHPVHNWIGLLGAALADALFQTFGVAVFLLPFIAARIGVRWVRSLRAGSPAAKTAGLLLWLLFAPAAIALLPGHLLWRAALPLSGVSGLILSDFLVQYLNLPGASVVLALLVAVSLYLTTTFTFGSARPWIGRRLGFFRPIADRWAQWRLDRRNAAAERAARREASRTGLRRAASTLAQANAPVPPATASGSTTLLGSLFGWLGRRSQPAPSILRSAEPPPLAPESGSVWKAMPRTVVDALPVTAFSTAAGAAAPFADALARAAAPWHEDTRAEPPRTDGRDSAPAHDVLAIATRSSVSPDAATWGVPPAAASAAPTDISFGKRADANIKAVAITPKSVRGYKLPPSSLLYHSEEHAQVREDALRDEARVLVEKCAEFDVDGQVTQINPGPVVTTFEFKPDAGVKYSRVTGLADDLCLAMAAESILIERMAGKSTVGIQVPNAERETIWLRDVVECESFAQSKSRLAIALGKDINGRIVTGGSRQPCRMCSSPARPDQANPSRSTP